MKGRPLYARIPVGVHHELDVFCRKVRRRKGEVVADAIRFYVRAHQAATSEEFLKLVREVAGGE